MTRSAFVTEKDKELRRLMHKNKVYEKDIKETFVRSSGPGGQNVNKVSTCVMLLHIPTGIQVKAQAARTQAVNRYKARLLLVKKVQQKIQDRLLKESQSRAKKRRQNRKRPKHLKEKILDSKHQQSEKKSKRNKIRLHKVKDLD